MKASQLIKKFQDLVEKHGDHDVVIAEDRGDLAYFDCIGADFVFDEEHDENVFELIANS